MVYRPVFEEAPRMLRTEEFAKRAAMSIDDLSIDLRVPISHERQGILGVCRPQNLHRKDVNQRISMESDGIDQRLPMSYSNLIPKVSRRC